MSSLSTSLRERTRRAVLKEIGDAAHALFVERGYEQTTIADIADAVGMSQRSVFRYFATKEDLVIGKFELVADGMLATLQGQRLGEPIWETLRRLLDEIARLCDDPIGRRAAISVLRVVFETPALFAAYLQKLQQLQEGVVSALIERAEAIDDPYARDDPTPRALTAAAFGCLVAAQHSWLAGGAEAAFGEALDRAMAVVRTVGGKTSTGTR